VDPEKLIRFFIENAVRWVETQRDKYRSSARNLTQAEKSEFRPFFEPEILDFARIKTVSVIKNPGFYSGLRDLNTSQLLDFRSAAGITFRDTILISERYVRTDSRMTPLVFHELVHVVQYAVLEVQGFITRYVRSWFENGLDYYGISLETQAYALQQRYEENPRQGFPVKDEVRQNLRERL